MRWLPADRFIVIASLALILAGCEFEREHTIGFTPVVAAYVSARGADGNWRKVPLTQGQARLLSQWLEAHHGGWRGLTATPGLDSFAFGFESTDGRAYSITVNVQAGGDGSAVVYFQKSSEPKRQYPLVRHLSAEDVQALRRLLGIANCPLEVPPAKSAPAASPCTITPP